MSVRLGDIIAVYKDEQTSGDFVEWLKKLELVATLKEVDKLEAFLPLFLSGPAFAVYSQLEEETQKDYGSLKAALISAFCASPFAAYEQLKERRLQPSESPDVYLADIKRLIMLTGSGVPL